MSFSPFVTLRLRVAVPADDPSKDLTGTSAVADAASAVALAGLAGGATNAAAPVQSSATAARLIILLPQTTPAVSAGPRARLQ